MSQFLDIQLPEDVLQRARAGEGPARAAVYSALSRPVYTLIRRLVVHPVVAEDLLQDVFAQQLEALLRGLPRPAVERAATAAAIDGLQARIQVLDLRLSNAQETGLDRTQTQRLWSERVQLLSSLVGVRYAERAARREFWPDPAAGDI